MTLRRKPRSGGRCYLQLARFAFLFILSAALGAIVRMVTQPSSYAPVPYSDEGRSDIDAKAAHARKQFEQDVFLGTILRGQLVSNSEAALPFVSLSPEHAAEWLTCYDARWNISRESKVDLRPLFEMPLTWRDECLSKVCRSTDLMVNTDFLDLAPKQIKARFCSNVLSHATPTLVDDIALAKLKKLLQESDTPKMVLDLIFANAAMVGRFSAQLNENSDRLLACFPYDSPEIIREKFASHESYEVQLRALPLNEDTARSELKKIYSLAEKEKPYYKIMLRDLAQHFGSCDANSIEILVKREFPELYNDFLVQLHEILLKREPFYATQILNRIPFGETRDELIRNTIRGLTLDSEEQMLWEAELGRR